MGGRIDDLAVLESNPAVFYVGTATGGLWKTVNNGTTWTVHFDDLDDVVSIGDIAINPERRQHRVGRQRREQQPPERLVGQRRLQVDRRRQDLEAHGPRHLEAHRAHHRRSGRSRRGLRRGARQPVGTRRRARHLQDDRRRPDVGAHPVRRRRHRRHRAGDGSVEQQGALRGDLSAPPRHLGLQRRRPRQRDVEVERRRPHLDEADARACRPGPLGRIGMDVYRSNPNIVYARIEHEKESGTYRSDDAGLSWRKMSNTNPRPMYFSQIRIDPNNDLRIYVLGVQIHISDDGGKTFIENGALHSDHHAMWINPKNSNHIIDGTDGGIGISWDKGATWEAVYNMDLGQFYHITYDMETPYNVCGGLQDNYTWCGPTAMRSRTGIANDQWFQIHGGDGFEAQIDPKNSRIIYAESQDGNISRIDKVSNERKSIRPLPARGEAPLRWNWNTPILMSPHDPATIYVGANKVFKSTDRGQSWTAISPDLTTATDRDGLPLMGVTGKETTIARNDGVQSYGNIVQLVESPKTAGVLYAGTDDGKVHMTRDGGKTWTDITSRFPGVPKNAYVSRLTASAHDVNVVYATFDNHRADDYGTYVYASVDGGNNFRSIGEGIPKGHTITAMAEDPKNPSVLYSGSEFGLFVSPDRGGKWMRIKSNLPTVPIHEIIIHPRDNDMIVATHGRSIWILDDITPLQQQAEAMKADAFLFDMRGGMQFNPANDRGFVSDKPFFGKNPTYGAAISYYLSKPQTNVALRIRDARGHAGA